MFKDNNIILFACFHKCWVFIHTKDITWKLMFISTWMHGVFKNARYTNPQLFVCTFPEKMACCFNIYQKRWHVVSIFILQNSHTLLCLGLYWMSLYFCIGSYLVYCLMLFRNICIGCFQVYVLLVNACCYAICKNKAFNVERYVWKYQLIKNIIAYPNT